VAQSCPRRRTCPRRVPPTLSRTRSPHPVPDPFPPCRRLGCLVASSREWHASVFCTSAGAGAAASAAEEAAKLCAIYQRAAAVAAPDDEPPEPVDGDKYWAAPQPLSERCALSLLPLQSADAFPELPPTVAWEGKRCHAPCVNLWLHGVKRAWPAV